MALGTLSLNVAANISGAVNGLNKVAGSATNVQQAASGASQGLGQVGTTGNTTSGQMGGLNSALGKVGGGMSALGPAAIAGLAAAGIAGVGMAAFKAASFIKGMASDAAKSGDDLHKYAIRAGITTKELQRLEHAAGQSGVGTDALRNALSRSTRPLQDVAEEVKNATSRQEAMTIATKEYGKSGARELLPMLLEGKEGIEALGDEAEALGGIMSGESIAASVAFTDSLGRMNTMTEGLKNTFGAVFLPAAAEVVDIVVEITKTVMSFLPAGQGMQETITRLVRGGMVTMLQGVNQLIGRIGQFARVLVPASSTLSNMGKVVVGAAQGFMAFRGSINVLQKIIQGFAVKAIGGLINAFSALMNMARDALSSLPALARAAIPGIEGIENALGRSSEAAKGASEAIDGLGNMIHESAEKDAKKLQERIESIRDLFQQDFSDDIENLLMNIANGSEEAEARLAELIDRVENADFAAELTVAGEEASGAAASSQAAEQDDPNEPKREAVELSLRENQLLQLKLDMLQANTEQERLQHELKLLELELEIQLDEIRKEELTDLEQAVALEQAKQDSLLKQSDVKARINELAKDATKETEETAKAAEDWASHLTHISSGLGGIKTEGDKAQKTIQGIQGAIKTATGLQAVFNAVAAANPLGAIAAAIGVIIGGIGTMTQIMGSDSASKDKMDQERRDEKLARNIAKEIGDDQDQRFGRPLNINIDASGALMGDEIEVGRKIADMIENEMPNRR